MLKPSHRETPDTGPFATALFATAPLMVALWGVMVVLALSTSSLIAGDWPQILGPHRNGIAEGEQLLDAWPEDGPQRLWQRQVGRGFSGVAVQGDRVIAFHRAGAEELVEALDRASGVPLWTARFDTNYQASIVEDDGPRSVPTIVGDRVVVFGAGGGLRCLSIADGSVLWARETARVMNVPLGYFGAGSSPLIYKGAVLLNLGAAREGAGIIAFSLDDGEEIWRSTQEQASYSSPILTQINGRDVVIFITRLNAIMLNPETGEVLAETRFGQRGPTVNGANPVRLGDHLFLTASYGIGAAWLRPTPNSLDDVWRSDDLLSSQYTTPIVHEMALIGIHGRQDAGLAELRCIDPAGRQVLWKQPGFGYATLLKAGDRLLIVKTDGTVILAEANSLQYRERGAASLMNGTVRALPALAGGLLFLRDERTVAAYKVGVSSADEKQGR